MSHLRMTTAAENAPETLEGYWRRKHDALMDESTPATVRSLRSQLQSIRQILQEETEPEEIERRILVHVELGLAVSRKSSANG